MSRPTKHDQQRALVTTVVKARPIATDQPDPITLERTKRYIKLFKEMDEGEAVKLLMDGIQAKLLLINDQILKQLEILDQSTNARERFAATATITALTASASQITENKIKLDKALGKDIEHLIQPGNEQSPIVETTEEDFMEEYAKERKLLTDGKFIIPVLEIPPKA